MDALAINNTPEVHWEIYEAYIRDTQGIIEGYVRVH